jgi:hypothetical protein
LPRGPGFAKLRNDGLANGSAFDSSRGRPPGVVEEASPVTARAKPRTGSILLLWLLFGQHQLAPGFEPPAGSPAQAPKPTRSRPDATSSGKVGPALGMTAPVACLSIDGLNEYVTLPGGALSSDEKLLVYYEPLRYRIDRAGSTNHIHLVQDGQIRRRGEKTVLLAKPGMLDYDWKSPKPPTPVYMRNTVSLKGLKPGEYEFDVILHDQLAPDTPVARQSLSFRIVPPGPRDGKGEVKPPKNGPTSP